MEIYEISQDSGFSSFVFSVVWTKYSQPVRKKFQTKSGIFCPGGTKYFVRGQKGRGGHNNYCACPRPRLIRYIVEAEDRCCVRMATNKLCQALKRIASAKIDISTELLRHTSNQIWKNPELSSKEKKAHSLLTSLLESEGFVVERSYTGIETAFRATFGSGKPNVCVICEYDALPEIGHACGHNLIAEAGIAAGLGLKAVLESSDAPNGTVTVMGTPAEEYGGGKIDMIDNGAFDGVDLAMMVHPAVSDILAPSYLACSQFSVTYTGKAAHAAAFPWEGVNALDAAVMAYTSISALRQQMKPTWRVHAIISDGGTKPNIIPESSKMELFARTSVKSELPLLVEKVQCCLKGASVASGCTHEVIQDSKPYYDLLANRKLLDLYKSNWTALGVESPLTGSSSGSTDMGNVSYVIPSIHPKFRIRSGNLAIPGIHTEKFASVANTPDAHRFTLIAAKAMAHTCVDVLTDSKLMTEITEEFKSSVIV